MIEDMVVLGSALEDVLPTIRQKLEQGEAHERHLRDLAEQQRNENNRMRKALAVIDPDYVHPNTQKPKSRRGTARVGVPRSNGTATGFGISRERAMECAAHILQMVDDGAEFVTQKDVYSDMGWDQSKSSAAFRYFRDIGFLRKAGKTEGGREKFAVLDRDAINKVTEEEVQNDG